MPEHDTSPAFQRAVAGVELCITCLGDAGYNAEDILAVFMAGQGIGERATPGTAARITNAFEGEYGPLFRGRLRR